MNTKNGKKPLSVSFIVFCVFFILLFLVLISTWKTTDIVAKFASNGSAEDDARAAKFIDVESGINVDESITVRLDPTQTSVQTFKFTINNNGETSINCDVSLKTLGILPLVVSVDKNDFDLNIGDETTFIVSVKWDNTTANYNDYNYSNLIDLVTVNVTCTQID